MSKQVVAGLISFTPFLLDGINEGFSSNLKHQVEPDSLSFEIDDSELSWIASANLICVPIGCLCGGILAEKLGRKKVMQLSCILVAVGWAFILMARSVLTMCIGRCFNGLALAYDVAATMYVAEITESPKYRAILLSLMNPAHGLGTTVSYVLGYVLPMRSYAISVCSLALLFLGSISWIPESPVWLMSNNRVEEAIKAMDWLRRKDDFKEGAKIESQSGAAPAEKLSVVRRVLQTRAWKPFLILTTFFALHELAGYTILVYYAADIYDLFRTPLSSSVSAIVLAILQFACWSFLPCIIDRLDRKILTYISTGGICASYAAVAVYEFVYYGVQPADKPLFWLPLACVWIGVIFTCVGVSSLPWIMIGELFPASVKDFMGSLQIVTAFGLEFVAVKSYPLLLPYLKIYGTFLVFSAAGFLGVLYALFLMPETRGKTLAEIEKQWLS